MAKSMKAGGGGRFAKLKGKLAKRKGVKNPGALAAYIGRKKYGKSRFQKMASRGKKRKYSATEKSVIKSIKRKKG